MKAIARLVVVSALILVGVSGAGATTNSLGNLVLARALNIELGVVQPGPHEAPLSSGALYAALQASGALDDRANAVQGGNAGGPNSAACGQRFTGGGTGSSTNTRVNQDCSLRRQAEEVIVVNPTNPDNLIAGQNDSRIGFNHCGYDFSFDGGKTWGDQVPPFWQFTLLDQHTSDACSDPTSAFDSKGNAYAGGIVFNVTSPANAIVVAKSNAPIGGAFYHSPDSTLSFQTYRDVPLGVVANDISPTIFNDKELMTADATSTSPKADRVYMTWTRFDTTTNNSKIFFSQSTNGGRTWSAGVPISGNNPVICTVGSTVPGDCDQDQGSDPVVGTDGTIYVTFGNANSPGAGLNQILFVKCPPSNNCSSSSDWSTPTKVGDLIDNAPVGPNSATGCPSGRECLPPNGYRVPEFTSDTVSVDKNGKLYVTWADFRNGGPPCTGSASTATPPCDNDVFYAYSTNGGATWSPTKKVTPAGSAQWQPWSGVKADGSALWIAYYDRQYGNCEFTGCNDITLAKVTNAATASPTFSYTRLTTSSMPNLVPANNPLQAGFLGDYMGLAVSPNGRPNIVWADTRGLSLKGTAPVEEDIYYATSQP